jgi:hypothetical protein
MKPFPLGSPVRLYKGGVGDKTPVPFNPEVVSKAIETKQAGRDQKRQKIRREGKEPTVMGGMGPGAGVAPARTQTNLLGL